MIKRLFIATVLMSTMLVSNVFAATSIYTGQQIDDSIASQRPIAVMIPTDVEAQSSYGISNADILYEAMEEGNISRQLAIIPDWQNIGRIGNIRSCRRYYTDLSKEWDSILVHFGGVCYMKGFIDTPDMNNISGTYEYGTGGAAPGANQFYRSSDRKAPHNAYISSSGIKSAAQQNGYSLTNRSQYYNSKHFNFGNNELNSGSTANSVDLSKVFSYTKSSFVYNNSTGTYTKYMFGKAHVDANNNQTLQFSNVIIQSTPYVTLDAKGYLDFSIIGSGSGWFCTKGKMIPITWSKTSAYSPTIYRDSSDSEIVLNPGKTYIAIAQSGKNPIFR